MSASRWKIPGVVADIDRAVTSLADRRNSGVFFLPDITINALRDEVGQIRSSDNVRRTTALTS
jgi:hypothetical protein